MNPATASPPSAGTDELTSTTSPANAHGIDPEDERVVPVALARLVETARSALQAVEVNAVYTPLDAVTAMEQTTLVLHRLGGHFDVYVGDFSKAGATSMGRARDLLDQARAELSAARNHLVLDGESSTTMPLTAAAEIVAV